MTNNFSIIIPIKNQIAFVKKCLDSILKYYSNQDIVLIDDCSNEETLIDYLDKLQKENIKLIRNKISLGHSRACEQGVDKSKNNNVFLLNSDTIVTKNSLDVLNDILIMNENIAVDGPTTSSTSGPQMINELFNKRFSMSITDIENEAEKISLSSDIVDIDLVGGFCLGIKKSIFNEVGRFDRNIRDYGNEKEFQIRVRKFGYRTVWVKGAYVHHFGKMSYQKENINIGKVQSDADKYIYKKHGTLK